MEKPAAIVTGAGRGIGRAAAQQLAQLGYRLTLVARTRSELENTAGQIANARVFVVDVTHAEQVNHMVQETVQHYGRLDAVIHCAGLAPVCSIDEMSVEQWHAVLDTNLSAAFYLCKAAWPIFRRQGSGVVVNVSSAAARDPFPGFAAYGAAKAGVNLLGLSAAREGHPFGIRVHTIAPSAVETGMFRQILSQEQYPSDKTLAPADVAKVIAQCVTGELRYTSGEVIYVHKTV